jgi:tRNA threonylcarbamoyladenosine biosynthesis protein TsaB
MKLLAFDTSTEVMSLAVQHGAQVFTHTGAGGAQASATLIPAIQALMAQAGLQFAQLDAIVFGRGPGSFTGLRTACSVAQGLAFAAGVGVLPVDTLMAVADEARHTTQYTLQQTLPHTPAPQRICAALDARMGEVYYKHYIFNSCLSSIDGAYSLKTPQAIEPFEAGFTALLAGNVRPTYDAQLPAALRAAPYVHCLPTATALLRLAPQLIASGGLVDAQDALPLYIRDKVAQTTAEREAIATTPTALAAKGATTASALFAAPAVPATAATMPMAPAPSLTAASNPTP